MARKNLPIISVAPMMDWTDRHCRYFHRLIAPSVTLYTEMVTTGALLFGDKDRFLRFDEAEHPLVLQLGGSDPEALATSAKLGQDYGYDEINLNCGCPSDRVQSGFFGACLMKAPELVAQCIKAMKDVVDIPVTVKCRIGIDDSEDYTFLHDFIETVHIKGGCETFIIHARKAWLKGLSPKENRDIPPLQYDIVERITESFPHLDIQINGGIKTIEQMKHHLGYLSPYIPCESGNLTKVTDKFPPSRERHKEGASNVGQLNGVMIGREAYQNPWFLREIGEEIYGTQSLPSAEDIVLAMIPYIRQQQKDHETPVKSITLSLIHI